MGRGFCPVAERCSGRIVMSGVEPSNLPCSTMMMVPSWPRIKPGMCCEFAIEELRTSECPCGIFGDQVKRVGHFALVLERLIAARGAHFQRELRLSQQMFNGATTWKNRSVAMPPE